MLCNLFMYMDVLVDICSCNICTSTIHGGRMPRAQDDIYGCISAARSMDADSGSA